MGIIYCDFWRKKAKMGTLQMIFKLDFTLYFAHLLLTLQTKRNKEYDDKRDTRRDYSGVRRLG